MQVLQYKVGQHYLEHHDYIEAQWNMPCGPRVLTFFIYLNSDIQGGETSFPKLNLKIKPQKGTAILWPSVWNNDPYKKLELTNHAGLDVINGTKSAINVWIHLHDFERPFKYGCTG